MKIVWSKQARHTFYNNINYLEYNWNIIVAQNFENDTAKTIQLIEKNPHLGYYNNYLNCNVILVSKQISLFYEINNDYIVLVTFWDNRQKPTPLKMH